METMKAVRIHEFGGPEVLRFEEAPRPEPGRGEVLVRVRATGLNPVDAAMRSGRMAPKGGMPKGVGLDFSGTIERVGPGVKGSMPGDEVYGRTAFGQPGAEAEFVVTRVEDIAAKPRSLDHVQAAALPTAALAAWQCLFESAGKPTMDLQPGQTVLIHGAAGGVGSFAVQLAKWKGAQVIATAKADDFEYVRSLGADQLIDYTQQRFEDVSPKVDAVLDVVGGETQARSWQLIKPGGVLVSTVGIQTDEEARRGVRAVGIFALTDRRYLEEIAARVDEGVLKVPVTDVFPLSQARQAHERLRTTHTRGKIVLSLPS